MQSAEKSINHMLVRLFNDILNIEERALATGEFVDASVREMHVLEAVGDMAGENNMSAVAARLGITVGSLTVAVTTLERKGYLLRERATDDKRVVHVRLTERGVRANRHHERFHEEMVAEVQQVLTPAQLAVLKQSLDQITVFFENYVGRENAIK